MSLSRFVRAVAAFSEHLPQRDRTIEEYGVVLESVAAQTEPFVLDMVAGNYQKRATVCRRLHEKGLLGRNAIGKTGVFWWK